jgi:hypothetical protein
VPHRSFLAIRAGAPLIIATMMKALLALLGGWALLVSAPARADVTLIMIRHGEKPEQGLGQLDCQGLNRALALPDVLISKFGRPDAIFAPNPSVTAFDRGKVYNYIRPLATIEPTAIRLGLPVNTRWSAGELAGVQQDLLGPDHAGQLIYVAWEHTLLVQLVRNILEQSGADPAAAPPWDSADFDSIYQLKVPTSGKASIKIEHEGLNGLSLLCPGQK